MAVGLNKVDGNVRLVVEDIVGALGLAADNEFSADDDPTLGEGDLFADLGQVIPASLTDGGSDELGADVVFRESCLHHTQTPGS